MDPDRAKAELVEGAIGELSPFHELNGYYAEGIHVETAVLPDGWRDRLVGWDLLSSDPARPHFLEPHDLAVAKLAAGREKDTAFVDAHWPVAQVARRGQPWIATIAIGPDRSTPDACPNVSPRRWLS